MPKIEGEAEAVAQNTPNRYGVKVGGKWHNGFGRLGGDKGDHVAIEYSIAETQKGYMRNIETIKWTKNTEKKTENNPQKTLQENDNINGAKEGLAWKLAFMLLSNEEKNTLKFHEIVELARDRARDIYHAMEEGF